MDAEPRARLASRPGRSDRLEVIDVRVHVAVVREPDEVQRARFAPRAISCCQVGAVEHRARCDRVVHELRALSEDPARAERVVTDLAVAHVVVGRKSDGQAVGSDHGGERLGQQHVDRGSVGFAHSV